MVGADCVIQLYIETVPVQWRGTGQLVVTKTRVNPACPGDAWVVRIGEIAQNFLGEGGIQPHSLGYCIVRKRSAQCPSRRRVDVSVKRIVKGDFRSVLCVVPVEVPRALIRIGNSKRNGECSSLT